MTGRKVPVIDPREGCLPSQSRKGTGILLGLAGARVFLFAGARRAWRKRRYAAALVRLNEAGSEAGETQTKLRFARQRRYTTEESAATLDRSYDRIIGKLVRMIANPFPANAEAKVNPFSSARPPL